MFWQIFCLIAIGLVAPAFILVGVVFSRISSDSGGNKVSGPLLIGGLVWGVIAVAGTPLVYNAFRHKILSFGEDLNAVVVAVKMNPTHCFEDGNCVWTYRCHPYLDTEYYYTTDANGKRKRASRTVTKYHECPYAEEEQTWITVTSLKEDPHNPNSDNVTITEAQHRLPENPQFHQWIEHQFIPPSILDAAGVGAPPISKHYQKLLDEDCNCPVFVKGVSWEERLQKGERKLCKTGIQRIPKNLK